MTQNVLIKGSGGSVFVNLWILIEFLQLTWCFLGSSLYVVTMLLSQNKTSVAPILTCVRTK